MSKLYSTQNDLLMKNLMEFYNKNNNLDKILFNGLLSNFTGFTKSYGKSIDIINCLSKHITLYILFSPFYSF